VTIRLVALIEAFWPLSPVRLPPLLCKEVSDAQCCLRLHVIVCCCLGVQVDWVSLSDQIHSTKSSLHPIQS